MKKIQINNYIAEIKDLFAKYSIFGVIVLSSLYTLLPIVTTIEHGLTLKLSFIASI